jgi:toxin-antitoxin system PIN domain toxin
VSTAPAPTLLLDVNALLALGWAEHEAHSAVVARLSQPGTHWATCPITQLGFVRLSSTAGIFSRILNPAQAVTALHTLCADAQHHFVAEHPSMTNCDFTALTGPRQTTDAYLLALAQHHGLVLLTLDQRLVRSMGVETAECVVAQNSAKKQEQN